MLTLFSSFPSSPLLTSFSQHSIIILFIMILLKFLLLDSQLWLCCCKVCPQLVHSAFYDCSVFRVFAYTVIPMVLSMSQLHSICAHLIQLYVLVLIASPFARMFLGISWLQFVLKLLQAFLTHMSKNWGFLHIENHLSIALFLKGTAWLDIKWLNHTFFF